MQCYNNLRTKNKCVFKKYGFCLLHCNFFSQINLTLLSLSEDEIHLRPFTKIFGFFNAVLQSLFGIEIPKKEFNFRHTNVQYSGWRRLFHMLLGLTNAVFAYIVLLHFGMCIACNTPKKNIQNHNNIVENATGPFMETFDTGGWTICALISFWCAFCSVVHLEYI